MESGFDGAFRNADYLCYLRDGQLFLIVQREDLVQGCGQFGEYLCQGFVEGGLVELHLYLLIRHGLCIEICQELCLVGIAPIVVPADVVGDGEEPRINLASLLIAAAGFVGPEEYVVRGVGRQLLVATQLQEEESLQPAGVAAVEFLEGCIAACRCLLHQLLVGLPAQGM